MEIRKPSRAVFLFIVLLLGGTLALVAFSDELYFFTTSLTSQELMVDETGFREYFVELTGEEGEVIAVAGAEVEARAEDLYWMRVSVWHQADTVLDTLTLRLNMNQIAPEVALMTPRGSWPPIHYRQTRDTEGVLVDVPDLGFQGQGTVILEFFLGAPLTSAPPQQLDLDMAFTVHEEGVLQLERSAGEVSIPIPLR